MIIGKNMMKRLNLYLKRSAASSALGLVAVDIRFSPFPEDGGGASISFLTLSWIPTS